MEIILPLLVRVFHEFSRLRNSSNLFVVFFRKVHVPHTHHEISEFYVVLESSANELVITLKICNGHSSIVLEILVGTVQRSEQIVKLKFGFFNSFKSSLNIWVSCRFKSIFYLV